MKRKGKNYSLEAIGSKQSMKLSLEDERSKIEKRRDVKIPRARPKKMQNLFLG